jgi:hypothetical protein
MNRTIQDLRQLGVLSKNSRAITVSRWDRLVEIAKSDRRYLDMPQVLTDELAAVSVCEEGIRPPHAWDVMQAQHVRWLRGIAAVEVRYRTQRSDMGLLGVLHLSSMVDYPVRIEALFRPTPTSARQTERRWRTSSNPNNAEVA